MNYRYLTREPGMAKRKFYHAKSGWSLKFTGQLTRGREKAEPPSFLHRIKKIAANVAGIKKQ